MHINAKAMKVRSTYILTYLGWITPIQYIYTSSDFFADQYWNGAFVNQPSQEASIVYARCH